MNFYKHHIGDYAAATGHLSILEDGVYSRLLRIYYRDEKPLPVDIKAVQRLAAARSRDEKDAVQTVLEEFFGLEEDGWHSKRADEEIARANLQADTNRRIAEEREERKRTTKAARSVVEPCNESSNESSRVREPSQTPDTRHQKELSPETLPERTRDARPPASFEPVPAPVTSLTTGNPAVPLAVAMNAAGFRCTALNPDLVAYAQAGGSVVHLLDVARHPDCQGKPVTYVARFALRELTAIANPNTGASHARPKESLAERVTRKAIAEELADRSATRDDDARSLGADDGDVRPPLVQHVR